MDWSSSSDSSEKACFKTSALDWSVNMFSFCSFSRILLTAFVFLLFSICFLLIHVIIS